MKKKYKVKPKKRKSKTGRSIGSEEYSVLGALNEDKYRAPVEIMKAAKAVMVDRTDDQYSTPDDVKAAAKKVTRRRVKRKK